MRLLCVDPGASYSTKDVSDGITNALAAQGHEIIRYRLDSRIAASGAWLHYLWRRAVKAGKEMERPNAADIQYRAGIDIIEKALRFQPDWVLVYSGMYCHFDIFIMMKRAGLRVALALSESPYDDGVQALRLPYVDVVWTNERTSVPFLQQYNPNVEYLPHSIDPERHRPDGPIPADVLAHDVVHVGTLFQERKELFERVDWTGIDLGLYGTFDMLGSRHPLRRFIRGDVQPNDTTAALYRAAKIGINAHRLSVGFGRYAPRITYAESMGPRGYELAATGCFHLSDRRAEVTELFGDLVPVFDGPVELGALIRKWLPDEAGRRAIAAQLPAAVQDCTFAARARQIADRLEAGVRQLSAVG